MTSRDRPCGTSTGQRPVPRGPSMRGVMRGIRILWPTSIRVGRCRMHSSIRRSSPLFTVRIHEGSRHILHGTLVARSSSPRGQRLAPRPRRSPRCLGPPVVRGVAHRRRSGQPGLLRAPGKSDPLLRRGRVPPPGGPALPARPVLAGRGPCDGVPATGIPLPPGRGTRGRGAGRRLALAECPVLPRRHRGIVVAGEQDRRGGRCLHRRTPGRAESGQHLRRRFALPRDDGQRHPPDRTGRTGRLARFHPPAPAGRHIRDALRPVDRDDPDLRVRGRARRSLVGGAEGAAASGC